MQAVLITDDSGKYTGWQVWTDKPLGTYRVLASAKSAASHAGLWYSKPDPKATGASP